jgi:hypothetical protein
VLQGKCRKYAEKVPKGRNKCAPSAGMQKISGNYDKSVFLLSNPVAMQGKCGKYAEQVRKQFGNAENTRKIL